MGGKVDHPFRVEVWGHDMVAETPAGCRQRRDSRSRLRCRRSPATRASRHTSPRRQGYPLDGTEAVGRTAYHWTIEGLGRSGRAALVQRLPTPCSVVVGSNEGGRRRAVPDRQPTPRLFVLRGRAVQRMTDWPRPIGT